MVAGRRPAEEGGVDQGLRYAKPRGHDDQVPRRHGAQGHDLETRDGRPEIAPRVVKDYDEEIYKQDQDEQEEVDKLDVIDGDCLGTSAQGTGAQEGMSVGTEGYRVENPVGCRDASWTHSGVPQSLGIPQADLSTLRDLGMGLSMLDRAVCVSGTVHADFYERVVVMNDVGHEQSTDEGSCKKEEGRR